MFGWLSIGDMITLHTVKVELPRPIHRLTHEVVPILLRPAYRRRRRPRPLQPHAGRHNELPVRCQLKHGGGEGTASK